MTHYPATGPAGRARPARLVHALARKLSDRLHAAADDHARALGWTVTQTRVPLGRSYRDPRFDARQQHPPTTTAKSAQARKGATT